VHDGVWENVWCSYELRWLKWISGQLSVKEVVTYQLKNIEQDIREISHDLNREKSELINNFVAIVDNLFEEQEDVQTKLVSNIDSSIKWESLANSVKINLYRIMQESLQNINKMCYLKLI
jgi:signal transduction histidine kinase